MTAASEQEFRDLSGGGTGDGFSEIIPVRISLMLLVQMRAAPQPLKSVQKPKPEPDPERFLSAGVRGAAPFLLHISLISSLMDCPGPGSVSGELHSARLWFIPGGMSRLPPIPAFSPSCAQSSLARGNKTASSPSRSVKPTLLGSETAEGRWFAAHCIPLFVTPGLQPSRGVATGKKESFVH